MNRFIDARGFGLAVCLVCLTSLNCRAEETLPVYPRFYIEDAEIPHCVIDTNLTWHLSNEKQIERNFREILDFLTDRPLKDSLITFGYTDVAQLSHLSLFYGASCDDAQRDAAHLKKELIRLIGLGKVELTMTPHSDSPLVIEKDAFSSLHDFPEKHREALVGCFISIQSPDKQMDAGKVFAALIPVAFKYQFPILNFSAESNGTIIVALFDQCEEKEVVMRRAMAWSDMAEEFAKPGAYKLKSVSASKYFELRQSTLPGKN